MKNNPRAAAVLAATTAIPLAIGLVLAASYRLHDSVIIAVLAGLLVLGGGAALGQRLLWLRTPRLAIERDQLLVYLRGLRPIRVPLEVVECLFLGQAPSLIRGSTGKSIQSTAIVVRLAERAKAWHQRDLPLTLGQWQDGQIIVRGTWCEPLDRPLIHRMNAELMAAKRLQRVSPR